MNHPTEEQLNAWIDGDAEALLRSGDTAAHVEQCARCQQRVEGTRSLGVALRAWADDAAPAPADDLFERIMADAQRPATLNDADRPGVNSAAEKPGETAKRTPDAVIPIARARRRFPAWAAAPVLLAAAAAAVFAITRPPAGVTPAGTGGEHHETRVASVDPGGSSVLAVDVGGAHTSYSVLEVAGNREGSTTAVVWIEDSSGAGAGAVQ